MNKIFLTSDLVFYDKIDGVRMPHAFIKDNEILNNFKKAIKKYQNFVYVASVEDNMEATDMYAQLTFKSFELTLPFENYYILDGRNKCIAEKLIKNADFILLSGGHVPSQNKFFNNINLRELIKNTDAVICGISAGSMNSADVVYCPPELEGEALDPNFQKYFKGLNLTKINIFPHFSDIKDIYVDDKHNLNDILIPDSYNHKIITLNDGAYLMIDGDKTFIYGESNLIYNGNIEQLCVDGKVVEYTL